jgi:hypothetical protein
MGGTKQTQPDSVDSGKYYIEKKPFIGPFKDGAGRSWWNRERSRSYRRICEATEYLRQFELRVFGRRKEIRLGYTSTQ